MPRLGVAIVNFNGREYLPACLASVLASVPPPDLVVVVDNASVDGSAEEIASAFPEVDLVGNAVNTGFTGGSNTGIRRCLEAGMDVVVLLNPDTVVEPGALAALAEGAARHPRSLVGPRLLMFDDPSVVNTYGTRISWWRGRIAGALEGADSSPADRRVGVLSGCCLLLTRDVVDEVGLLAEGYFLYFEDADLAARAAARGFELWVVPASRVLHRESRATGGPASPLANYFFTRNRHRFVTKFKRGRPAWFAFLAYSTADALQRAARAALAGERRKAAAVFAGLWDGWRGREGPAGWA